MCDAGDVQRGPDELAEFRQRSWLRTLRGYLLLPHLAPVVVVLLATLGFSVIAWGGIPPAKLLARLLIAMLGGQLAIGALNEIVDLPDDAIGKPGKPLPSGDVSLTGAKVTVALGLLLMIVFGMSLGLLPLGLLVLGTGAGLAYDLWLKRTPWSWAPYLVALPLLPIWVFVALGRPEPQLLLLYPLGALAAAGVHFAQALPDVSIDQAAGLRTPTSRLGSLLTFVVAWVATITAPLLAIVVSLWLEWNGSREGLAIAVGVEAILAITNIVLYAVNRRKGELICFPFVAISLVVSGLAWTWMSVR